MSRAPIRWFLVVSLVGVVACGDAVRAPITIVVDTDRSRAVEDQGRLQELRAGVQGDRAVLAAARTDLEQARRRLETASQGAQRDAALAEVRAIEARLPVQPAGAQLTRADLDVALAAQEQRLATIIVAELARTAQVSAGKGAAGPPSSASSTSPAASATAVMATMDRARSAARARGLSLVDLDGGAAAADLVSANLQRGDVATALDGAQALASLAETSAIDRVLVQRKYLRVNVLVTRDPSNTKAASLVREASQAITRGELVVANASLNEAQAAVGQ